MLRNGAGRMDATNVTGVVSIVSKTAPGHKRSRIPRPFRIASTRPGGTQMFSCIGLYFLDLSRFTFLPRAAKATVVGLLTSLLILFSGIVFSREAVEAWIAADPKLTELVP